MLMYRLPVKRTAQGVYRVETTTQPPNGLEPSPEAISCLALAATTTTAQLSPQQQQHQQQMKNKKEQQQQPSHPLQIAVEEAFRVEELKHVQHENSLRLLLNGQDLS